MPPTQRPRVYGRHRAPDPAVAAVSAVFSSTSPVKQRRRPDVPIPTITTTTSANLLDHEAGDLGLGPRLNSKPRVKTVAVVPEGDASADNSVHNPVHSPVRKAELVQRDGAARVDEADGPQQSGTSPAEPGSVDELGTRIENLDISTEPTAPSSKSRTRTRPRPTPPSRQQKDTKKEDDESSQGTNTPPSPPASYFCSLLPHCADRVARRGPIPFSSWADSLDDHFTIRKIAEASFGEVFRLCVRDRAGTGLSRADESVIKILAVRPPESEIARRGGESSAGGDGSSIDNDTDRYRYDLMSPPDSIRSEILLLNLLSSVPGFTNFRDLRLVIGQPPPTFATAWTSWNAAQPASNKSCFPDWAVGTNYPEDQVWAIIEMQDAGFDLEAFVVRDVWSVWDIFWGVVLAVAKAEGNVGFEHRDMHLGNICVNVKGFLPRSSTGQSDDRDESVQNAMFSNETSQLLTALSEPAIWIGKEALAGSESLSGRNHSSQARTRLHFTDLEPTIIDYSISRAELEQRRTPRKSSGDDDDDPEVAFLDLSTDADIFAGDGSVHYQYDMYRFMRSAAFLDDPLAKYPPRRRAAKIAPSKQNGADAGDDDDQVARTWRGFHPQTNVVWLHFLLHELMQPLESLVVPGDVVDVDRWDRTKRQAKSGAISPTREEDEDGGEIEEGKKDDNGDSDSERDRRPRRRPQRAAAVAAANAMKQESDHEKNKASRRKKTTAREPVSPLTKETSNEDTTKLVDQRDQRFSQIINRIRVISDPDSTSPDNDDTRILDPHSDTGRAILSHGQYLEASLGRVSRLLSLHRWSDEAKKMKRRRKRVGKSGAGGPDSKPRSRMRRESTTAVELMKDENAAGLDVEPDVDECGPLLRSAGDLVAVALRHGWLDEQSVLLAG